MKILILGADGYIGSALSQHLINRGHSVILVDDLSKRKMVKFKLIEPDINKNIIISTVEDLCLSEFDNLDTIVHLAEQPSAPWSMKSKKHALETQQKNVLGTLHLLWEIKENCPDVSLVHIGTMGVYGYNGDADLPEGFIEDHPCKVSKLSKTECPMSGLPYPHKPQSFYHISKAIDALNIQFACETWGLKATDIMQGIVFGVTDTLSRFSYCSDHGTVINRFCSQAIADHPITVYGKGGQTRGFLPLSDSLECLTLVIENPPKEGEYRVFNQFARIYSVLSIARAISDITGARIEHLSNPRVEAEEHVYFAKNDGLKKLGYEPKWKLKDELIKLIDFVRPFRYNVQDEAFYPVTNWRNSDNLHKGGVSNVSYDNVRS